MENQKKIFEMILYDNFTEKQGIALPDYINMINVMIDLYISQKKISERQFYKLFLNNL